MYNYKVVTVGGTFDYLHKGHRAILRRAFEISERVVVGVASDKMALRVGKSLAGVGSFNLRTRKVRDFLKKEEFLGRAKIIEIRDMFGPLRENRGNWGNRGDMGIEAMIVTRQTRGNAEKINRWRKANGLSKLNIVEIDMEPAGDGEPISSRRIRAGEIDREGVVYRLHKLWGNLPRAMREELRQPMGKVIGILGDQDIRNRGQVISVGDVSTRRILKAGIKPDLAVFDLKVRRKKVFKRPEDIGVGKEYKLVKIKNPAGGVSKELYQFFKETPFKFERSLLLKIGLWIEGEEDLAVLPAVLFAPLGAKVVYGFPPTAEENFSGTKSAKNLPRFSAGGSLVVVEVGEKEKKKAFDILKKFT